MKRHWVFALATLVAIPRPAHAQSDAGWVPQIRVTPWIGVSPGSHQSGTVDELENGTVTRRTYRIGYKSSVPVGVNAELQVWNMFSIVAEGVWSSRGTTTFQSSASTAIDSISGTNLFMGTVGAALHFSDVNPEMQLRRLGATLFVGPAFIRDDPKVETSTPAFATNAINQFGLNMGANAEIPLANNRLAFQIGLENFMTFSDNDGYGARVLGYVQQGNPNVSAVAVDAGKMNVWIGRVGLTFRF